MNDAPPLPFEPSKVAVLRANAIGDFVFALPALEALRARFPSAEIVLLGQRWHHDFLRGRPSPVDRVFALPPIPGVGAPSEAARDDASTVEAIDALRAEHFDLALQLHGGGRHSNRLLNDIGARLTAGLRTPDAPPLDRSVPYVYFQGEILRLLEAVAVVGARPVTLVPRLAVTAADRAEAAPFLEPDQRRLVAFHLGAGDARRRWPLEHFLAVAGALARRGFRITVVGGREEDLVLAAAFERRLPAGSVRNAAGRLSLGGTLGLLAAARLLVSNDSGPLHLAEAVGTPTVGIYWCGNLVNADPITRSTHRPVLSWRLDCPVCGANVISDRCAHDASFVDQAPVEEVLAQALELLGERPEGGSQAGWPLSAAGTS